MDVSYVNPFIRATVETFKTMLGLDVTTGTPMLKKDANHSYDISGVIGLSGEAQGIISISFPKTMALKIVSILLNEEIKIVTSELTDGIGEMANIIAGNTKQYLTQFKLSISLPNVVVGKGHRIEIQSGVPTIAVPMRCSLGQFAMEVALKTK